MSTGAKCSRFSKAGGKRSQRLKRSPILSAGAMVPQPDPIGIEYAGRNAAFIEALRDGKLEDCGLPLVRFDMAIGKGNPGNPGVVSGGHIRETGIIQVNLQVSVIDAGCVFF